MITVSGMALATRKRESDSPMKEQRQIAPIDVDSDFPGLYAFGYAESGKPGREATSQTEDKPWSST